MRRFGSMTLLCAGALLATAPASRAGEEAIQLTDAPGRATTAAHCAVCHSLDYIPMNAAVQNREGWQKTVRKMIDRFGAPVTDDQAREIVDYLASHYSKPP
jgi:mono/diheme cytochrome c family protein